MTAAHVRGHVRPKTTDDLAVRLRACRTSAGMTQAALAAAAGISVHRLGHLERARCLPRPEEIGAWCRSTGTDGQTADLDRLATQRRPAVIEYT